MRSAQSNASWMLHLAGQGRPRSCRRDAQDVPVISIASIAATFSEQVPTDGLYLMHC
jgi:hypothetical protein